MKHFLFDTETTNLIHNTLQPLHKQPHIIELFGLVLDDQQDWAEVGTINWLIKPPVPIEAKITEITGITNDMVATAPAWAEKAAEFISFMTPIDVVVAHNLSYDMAVVSFEMQRSGLPLRWPERRTCTVEATEHLKGYRLKLVQLHELLFGVGFEAAHRAENDVRAMARCYVELHKRGEL